MNSWIFTSTAAALARRIKTQTRRLGDIAIRLPDPVASDPCPGARGVVAARGFYPAQLNPHGAVFITVDADVTGGSARVVEPFKLGIKPGEFHFVYKALGIDAVRATTRLGDGSSGKRWIITPPPGKRVAVRERWRAVERESDGVDGILYTDGTFKPIANSSAAADLWVVAYDNGKHGDRWRSPMFMYDWMVRFELAISSVRIERLHDITEEDAVAEGIEPLPLQSGEPGCWWTGDVSQGQKLHGRTAVSAYEKLWRSIHGPKSWDGNPWVFASTFSVCDRVASL